MSSDLILGAVIGGVVVLVLLNKKNAAASLGAGIATTFPVAGPSGCGCAQNGESLCDVLTRY